MTPKILGIIQVKGGAGRSTVSTNLAGELSKLGKTVLIDCDMPQGTAASWYAVRQVPGNLSADTAGTHKERIVKVQQHQHSLFLSSFGNRIKSLLHVLDSSSALSISMENNIFNDEKIKQAVNTSQLKVL